MKRLLLLTLLAGLSLGAHAQAQTPARTILVPEFTGQRRPPDDIVMSGSIKNNWEVPTRGAGLLYVATINVAQPGQPVRWQYLALGRTPTLQVGEVFRFTLTAKQPPTGTTVRLTVRGKINETDTQFTDLSYGQFELPPPPRLVPDLAVTAFTGSVTLPT